MNAICFVVRLGLRYEADKSKPAREPLDLSDHPIERGNDMPTAASVIKQHALNLINSPCTLSSLTTSQHKYVKLIRLRLQEYCKHYTSKDSQCKPICHRLYKHTGETSLASCIKSRIPAFLSPYKPLKVHLHCCKTSATRYYGHLLSYVHPPRPVVAVTNLPKDGKRPLQYHTLVMHHEALSIESNIPAFIPPSQQDTCGRSHKLAQ